jgi:catechol 2,3-dioxygenase-like lactoylglutathione lyase family enzyme
MIEHVSLRCGDPGESRRFYEKALQPLGYTLSKKYGDAFGFKQGGRHDFWISEGEVGTPNHVAFTAATREAVDAFYQAAIKAGGEDNGPPGVRKGYGYAAFVYDLDGHNIEAICFDELEEDETLEQVQRKRIAQAKGEKKKAAKAPAKKR